MTSNRPLFEYEVRHLIETPQNHYERCGLVDNPFHFFQGACDPHLLRRQVLEHLQRMVEKGELPYVSGNIIGGSGKTFLLNRLAERFAIEDDTLVVQISDLVRYRYPLCSIDAVCQEIESILTATRHRRKLVILDEVEFQSVYGICLNFDCRIVAGGHYLERDAGAFSHVFSILDLDADWPISSEEVLQHLLRQIEHANALAVIPRGVAELVARDAPTIGTAELVIGLLLATYANRRMEGMNQGVSTSDAKAWLDVLGTNWFWFSMDCWRVRNPVEIVMSVWESGRCWNEILTLDIGITERRLEWIGRWE